MAEFERLHVGNSEVQEKQALAYQFAQTSTIGLAVTGVLAGLVVRQTTTASGSVILGAGSGVIGSTVGAGASGPVNPGDVTFDVFTANPMGGLPRNDIMVWDSATKAFGVVVGTPNASPGDPTVANTKLPLARLRHAASATTIPTAKIDDLRVFTAPFGRDTFQYGDTGVVKGTSPATTTAKIRQEFTTIITTGGGGAVGSPFPTPFPNGITFLSVTPGDNTSSLAFIIPILSVTTLSAWNGTGCLPGGSAIGSGLTVRVNVAAVGW